MSKKFVGYQKLEIKFINFEYYLFEYELLLILDILIFLNLKTFYFFPHNSKNITNLENSFLVKKVVPWEYILMSQNY